LLVRKKPHVVEVGVSTVCPGGTHHGIRECRRFGAGRKLHQLRGPGYGRRSEASTAVGFTREPAGANVEAASQGDQGNHRRLPDCGRRILKLRGDTAMVLWRCGKSGLPDLASLEQPWHGQANHATARDASAAAS